MKKTYLILAILFFSFQIAKAQEANGVIKINPIGLFYSANLTYEKPITAHSSVMMRFRYYYGRLNFTVNNTEEYAITSGSIDFKFGYRFYPSSKHEAPNGFYISPTANLLLRAEEKDDFFRYRPKKTMLVAGAHVGRQWL